MREASTIMSKGTSKLAAAKAKLATLEKEAAVLLKTQEKATKAWTKAQDKVQKQAEKVAALEPAQNEPVIVTPGGAGDPA